MEVDRVKGFPKGKGKKGGKGKSFGKDSKSKGKLQGLWQERWKGPMMRASYVANVDIGAVNALSSPSVLKHPLQDLLSVGVGFLEVVRVQQRQLRL